MAPGDLVFLKTTAWKSASLWKDDEGGPVIMKLPEGVAMMVLSSYGKNDYILVLVKNIIGYVAKSLVTAH